jgi:hypothetical protein
MRTNTVFFFFTLQHVDRKYITMLANSNYFVDYVEAVLLDERTCLNNPIIYSFLSMYFPKVTDLNYCFLYSPVTSSLFGPNILLNILFSNSPSQCLFLNITHQVSHPYSTTAKLYSCIFWFLRFLTADKKTEESGPNGSKHYQNSISS